MSQIIIYPNEAGRVVVVAPAPDSNVSAIVEATVPAGRPWRLVDTAALPSGGDWVWSDSGPIRPAPPSPPPPPSLTPAQWGFFLDLTGFRDALDAALAAMPKETMQERAAWAGMRNIAYGSEQYRLDVTLALVAKVRASGLPVEIPSDEEITAAFTAAAEFKGAASLLGD